MNNLSKVGLGVLAVVAMAFTNKLEDGNYGVSLEQSQIEWVGKKVTGQHNGTVAIKSGALKIEDGKLSGGEFVIDMTTLTATDLEGEYRGKLNGHLKSEDFFGVEKYPEARLVITKVVSGKTNGKYTITGDMTIKSTTEPITFEAQMVNNGNQIVAVGDIVIDRSKFDVRYGSGSFFDNLGDKTIYDDFTLSVKIVTE